jgi:hypothetical protein
MIIYLNNLCLFILITYDYLIRNINTSSTASSYCKTLKSFLNVSIVSFDYKASSIKG